MALEDVVAKLVSAILLSALHQRAEQVLIHPGTAKSCVVEFSIQGILRVEMRPPQILLAPIVQRLSDLANLPSYAGGEYASGTIHLIIGADRHEYFGVVVTGPSASRTATITIVPRRSTNRR
jgi:hypothetical protein